ETSNLDNILTLRKLENHDSTTSTPSKIIEPATSGQTSTPVSSPSSTDYPSNLSTKGQEETLPLKEKYPPPRSVKPVSINQFLVIAAEKRNCPCVFGKSFKGGFNIARIIVFVDGVEWI